MTSYTGSDEADDFVGTADADLASGNGGDDSLAGLGGDDRLHGGEGDDRLDGGDGSDRLYGGGDDDRLDGGDGDDALVGGEGSDVLVGGAGNDHLFSYAADGGSYFPWTTMSFDIFAEPDSLAGGDGYDTLSAGYGDSADGGANEPYGGDRLFISFQGAPGGVTADFRLLAGGPVTIGGGTFANIEEVAFLEGSEFDDFLAPYNATPYPSFAPIYGRGGNDHIVAGVSTGPVEGGDGNDLIDLSAVANAHNAWGGAGDDRMIGGGGYYERLNGGDGNDILEGNQDNDLLYGDAGSDRLEGGAGDDSLYGGDGADTLAGGPGEDTLSGEGGSDVLYAGGTLTPADRVSGGADHDTLVLQGDYSAGLTLTGTVEGIEAVSILAGSNTAFGEPGTHRYDYVLTTNDANFAAGVQARINGSALLEGEDFTFDGSAETDASFIVYGGLGTDRLTGGSGNDIFFFDIGRFAAGDTVNGGPGYDGLFLRGNYTIDFTAPGYAGALDNIENITLTSATDERYARGGGSEFDYNLVLANAILGAGRTLTISGALLTASETMVVDGSRETEGLLRLFGGAASDTLTGGGQADLIHGNLGADTLTGGGGADTFRYQSTAESGARTVDNILDFTPGTDKIDLERIDADTLAAGDQAFRWIGSDAFSGGGAASAGELRAYEDEGLWYVEGDTNGDGAADLVITLTLQGAVPLEQGDFIL